MPAIGLLCLLPGPPAAPQTADAPQAPGYFRRHAWHWAVAFGTSLADSEYERIVGTSTDPLIFDDPPGVDTSVRTWLMDEDYKGNFVIQNRSTITTAIAVGAAVFSNVGRPGAGRMIADDVTGVVEVWFFDKGASGLMKNIVGRERPELEFIEDDPTLTPAEIEEELAKRRNRQSFYSGATSRTFSLMSYGERILSSRLRRRTPRVIGAVLMYGYAAYVGISRIQSDDHYLTDVMTGATAGILTGRGFYRAHHPRRQERPGGGGGGSAPPAEPRLRLSSFTATPGGFAVMFAVGP